MFPFKFNFPHWIFRINEKGGLNKISRDYKLSSHEVNVWLNGLREKPLIILFYISIQISDTNLWHVAHETLMCFHYSLKPKLEMSHHSGYNPWLLVARYLSSVVLFYVLTIKGAAVWQLEKVQGLYIVTPFYILYYDKNADVFQTMCNTYTWRAPIPKLVFLNLIMERQWRFQYFFYTSSQIN